MGGDVWQIEIPARDGQTPTEAERELWRNWFAQQIQFWTEQARMQNYEIDPRGRCSGFDARRIE